MIRKISIILLLVAATFMRIQPIHAEQKNCVDFPVGQNRSIGHSQAVSDLSFSPDGKFVATSSYDHSVKILNRATGEEKTLNRIGQTNSVQFSSDSKKLIFSDAEAGIIIDLETMDEEKLDSPEIHNAVRFAELSPNAQYALAGSSGQNTVVVRDLKTSKDKVFACEGLKKAHFNADSSSTILVCGNRSIQRHDLHTGVIYTQRVSAEFDDISFSSDGKKMAGFSPDGTIIVLDPATGKEEKIKGSGWIQSAKFSPDNSLLLASSNSGEILIRNLTTNNEQRYNYGEWLKPANFSPDGRHILFSTGSGVVILKEIKTGKEIRVRDVPKWPGPPHPESQVAVTSFSADGHTIGIGLHHDNHAILSEVDYLCISNDLKIEDVNLSPEKRGFQCQDSNNHNVSPDQLSQFGMRASCNALCNEPFHASDWDKLTGSPPTSGILPNDQAELFLLRFQKLGGFNPRLHLNVLTAILTSDLAEKQPDLISGALLNVLHESNQLYEFLVKRFPGLTKVSSRVMKSNPCWDKSDTDVLKKDVWKYFQFLKVTVKDPGDLKNWQERLDRLGPILKILPSDQKEEAEDYIAQKLADAAADSKEFHGIFISKLYKLAKGAVAPMFGDTDKRVTDLTLSRDRNQVRPVILGNQPIFTSDATPTKFGFFAKQLDPTTVPEDAIPGSILENKEYSWEQGNKKYRAAVNIKVSKNSGKIIPEDKAPRYEELWKDGKLSGVVITGSNLLSLSHDVMDQYLGYYKEQGFTFSTPPQHKKNIKQLLKDGVQSGEFDYLIKEAHSDGDEKNLFRLDREAECITGIRKLKDGGTEKILLVSPGKPKEGKQVSTELLSNDEFGSWIRQREKQKKGQFVYFNTSCWSKTKAVHEIEAAHSKTLLNIPAVTEVLTFANTPTNAEFQLLDTFRRGGTFDEMRTSLEKNEGFVSGKSNRFIFPDEERYVEEITKVLATPLDIQIRISGPGNKPYSIEELH